LHHVGHAKPDSELVARYARLRDAQLRGADAETVADADGFQQAFRREILPKHSPGQLLFRELAPPVVVVLDGIGVDRLLRSTVDGEIRLAVALEIQKGHTDGTFDRLLENAGGDSATVERNFTWEAYAHRPKLHDADWMANKARGIRVGAALKNHAKNKL